jgi:hypothetical protein
MFISKVLLSKYRCHFVHVKVYLSVFPQVGEDESISGFDGYGQIKGIFLL